MPQKRRATLRRMRIGCAIRAFCAAMTRHRARKRVAVEKNFARWMFASQHLYAREKIRANRRRASPPKHARQISNTSETRISSAFLLSAKFSLRGRDGNEFFRAMFSQGASLARFERARRGAYTEN
jgi:hypothetical protein